MAPTAEAAAAAPGAAAAGAAGAAAGGNPNQETMLRSVADAVSMSSS